MDAWRTKVLSSYGINDVAVESRIPEFGIEIHTENGTRLSFGALKEGIKGFLETDEEGFFDGGGCVE